MRLKLKAKIPTDIPDDDQLDFEDYEAEDEFKYLRFKKPGEIFTRVDRYSIVRYYYVGDEVRAKEFLFYPSPFGFDEIRNHMISNTSTIHGQAAVDRLIKNMYQLIAYGNADWNRSVNQPLQRASVKKIKLQVRQEGCKRLALKTKPITRLRLKVK